MTGERILEFCGAAGMIVCGTQFSKTESKLIFYSSGGYNTTVDYLLAQKQDRKYLKDAKAFPGEEVTSLHRLMVCNEVNRRKSSQKEKFQPRRKVWKLRNPGVRKRFEEVFDIEEKEERNKKHQTAMGINTEWHIKGNRRSVWMDKRSCKTPADMVVE